MAGDRLEATARACRVQILRMLAHAGSGHPGGSLSVIDILVTLFFGRLRHDPQDDRARIAGGEAAVDRGDRAGSVGRELARARIGVPLFLP